jgi:hypothetical protein
MAETSSTPGKARAPDEWATPAFFAGLLGLTIGAFFFPVLFGGRSFFYRDYGVIGYPVIVQARESFWRGEFPLWNPLNNCGTPFLAQWGSMSFYPLSLVYLVLPLPWSLGFFCALHLFLGGWGAYWLIRRHTASPLAPMFAGLLFAINGVTLSCLIWPNYAVAIGWMPWVVMLAGDAAARGRGAVILAAGAAAMQLLAGVPELAALTWTLAVFLVAAQTETRTLSGLLRIGVVVLLATGLIAGQFLPFWQLLQSSQRDAGFGGDRWSLPIWGLGNFLEPLFHCFKTPEGVFFQPGQEFINSCYFGLGSLALVGLAFRRPRDRLALPLGFFLVLMIALSMGDQAGLYHWLREIFPPLGFARFPVKFLLPAILLVPALAAFGLDGWLQAEPPDSAYNKRGLAISASVVLAALGVTLWRASQHRLYYDQINETLWNGAVRGCFLLGSVATLLALGRAGSPRPRAACFTAFAALVALDLATHTPWQNPTLPNGDFQAGAWETSTHFKAPKLGEGRVMISPGAEDRLLHSSVSDLESDYLGKRLALWSNLHLLESTPKINGSSTLQIRAEAEVQNLVYKKPRHDLPWLADFLGARYVNDPKNILDWGERPGAMPLVTAGQKAMFTTNTLGAWLDGFDPRTTAVFPERLRPEIGEVAGVPAVIDHVSFGSQRVQFRCAAGAKCLAVVGQSYYPCWKAYVDGQPTPLWPANHAFQAIVAPPGRHEIALVYEDVWFRRGLEISALTLLVCLGAAWNFRRLSA